MEAQPNHRAGTPWNAGDQPQSADKGPREGARASSISPPTKTYAAQASKENLACMKFMIVLNFCCHVKPPPGRLPVDVILNDRGLCSPVSDMWSLRYRLHHFRPVDGRQVSSVTIAQNCQIGFALSPSSGEPSPAS
jgi:hypothetical protein